MTRYYRSFYTFILDFCNKPVGLLALGPQRHTPRTTFLI